MAMLECPIRKQARLRSNETAIILPNQRISYLQLDQFVESVVTVLTEQQIQPDDVIVSCCDNSIETIALMFASLRQNAIFCPFSVRTTNIEKQQRLQQINAKLAFFDADESTLNTDTICKSTALLNLASVNLTSRQVSESNHQLAPIFYSSDRASTLLFTSGSSGSPKAVIHSLSNHYYSALGAQQSIELTEQDCWLASLPFNHIGGLAIVFRCLFAGASIALVDRKSICSTLQNYPITHVSLVPTQLYRLIKDVDINNIQWSLKYLLLGGAPLDSTYSPMLSDLGVKSFYSYGLTEMASQVSTKDVVKTSFGKPLPYRSWKLIDGEIWVTGKTLFKGYLVNGQLEKPFIDGWFATKDLAIETTQGLTISGRKDNMFICGGENYQPEHVEAIINKSPLVERSIVVSVNDKEFGKIAVVFIDWAKEKSNEQLLDFLNGELTRIMIPKKLFNWPENAPEGFKVNRQWFSQHAKQCME